MNIGSRGLSSVPQMRVPEYWVSSPDEVAAALRNIGVTPQRIGASSAGREILGVVLDTPEPLFTFGLIAGIHGHESGGTAAALSLISAVVRGVDLTGQAAAEILRSVRWAVIPLANPDGRLRCPNSFVGMTSSAVEMYGSGWDEQGVRLARRHVQTELKPGSHLGGLYNDAGVDIHRVMDGTLESTESVEVAAVASFLREQKCDLILDLHAHNFDFMFYTPQAKLPEPVANEGFKMAEAVRAELTQAGLAFAAPECVAANKPAFAHVPSSNLYHNVTGAVPFLVEGPQGTIDAFKSYYGGQERQIRDPGYDHAGIIQGYLAIIASLARVFSAS